tara:strand:+ start:1675 stop:2694 length:1020 start_codon:yes stop_codon:yes gene_type:complete
MGNIRTVLGDVSQNHVGNIMIHEHILFDIASPGNNLNYDKEIKLSDRWQVDYFSNKNPENASQKQISVAAEELKYFSEDGGSLIVDQSVFGLDRNPEGLAKVSELSGVHIVAAAGCYTEHYLPKFLVELEYEQLSERFVNEIEIGLDGTDIRAGILGEIGCSWPITTFERMAVKAAASAAKATGTALSIHPGRAFAACSQILDIIDSAGLEPSRVILCHMDRTFPTGHGVAELLKRGANVEWDFFGIEQSYYWMDNTELPNDYDRLRLIQKFVQEGYEEQILISHDICTKTRMRSFGGHGYSHILRNIPELFKRLGFDKNMLKKLIHENPLKVLTLKEV